MADVTMRQCAELHIQVYAKDREGLTTEECAMVSNLCFDQFSMAEVKSQCSFAIDLTYRRGAFADHTSQGAIVHLLTHDHEFWIFRHTMIKAQHAWFLDPQHPERRETNEYLDFLKQNIPSPDILNYAPALSVDQQTELWIFYFQQAEQFKKLSDRSRYRTELVDAIAQDKLRVHMNSTVIEFLVSCAPIAGEQVAFILKKNRATLQVLENAFSEFEGAMRDIKVAVEEDQSVEEFRAFLIKNFLPPSLRMLMLLKALYVVDVENVKIYESKITKLIDELDEFIQRRFGKPLQREKFFML